MPAFYGTKKGMCTVHRKLKSKTSILACACHIPSRRVERGTPDPADCWHVDCYRYATWAHIQTSSKPPILLPPTTSKPENEEGLCDGLVPHPAAPQNCLHVFVTKASELTPSTMSSPSPSSDAPTPHSVLINAKLVVVETVTANKKSKKASMKKNIKNKQFTHTFEG